MNGIVAYLAACLAVASAGYIEHYQGATSFSSFDLKSTGGDGGSGHYVPEPPRPSPTYSKVVASYESKPIISTVYNTVPITKTVTQYASAPLQYASTHHYAHGSECALKEQKLIASVPPAISLTSSKGQLQTGYPTIKTEYRPAYTSAPLNTGSTSIGHSISHQYTPAAQVTGGLYSAGTGSYEATFASSSQKGSSSSYGQSSSFGAHQTYVPSVQVTPPKTLTVYGGPVSATGVSYAPQVLVQHSHVPVKATQSLTQTHFVNSGASAIDHQYNTAVLPVKTSQYYVAPTVSGITHSSGSSLAIPVKTSQYFVAPTVSGISHSSGSSLAIPVKTSQYYVAPVVAAQASSSSSQTSGASVWKQPTQAVASIPAKPSKFYLAPVVAVQASSGSSASASSASYGSSSTPLKTSQYYVAPIVQQQAASGSAWKGSTSTFSQVQHPPSKEQTPKEHGGYSYVAPAPAPTQQYLPPKATVVVPAKEPTREYLPTRDYLPPQHQQQHNSNKGSSIATGSSHASLQTSHYGVVSPLHVTVQKTPVLVTVPQPDCSQHRQLH